MGAQGTTGTTGQKNPYANVSPMATPAYNPAAYKPADLTPVQADPNQYKLAYQAGMQPINQGAKAAQSQLMGQMGARGLGQSGLAMQNAINQYQRGAGQQAGQLGSQLASQNLGQIYQSGLQSQNLASQQASAAAQFGQNEAGKRADLELGNRGMNANIQQILGNLGLAERQQGLSELSAQHSWEDAPLSLLGGLGTAAMAASASKAGGGKGGGK